jgi:hypothetical protein
MPNKKIQRTRNGRFLILARVVNRAADLGRCVEIKIRNKIHTKITTYIGNNDKIR